MNLPIVKGKVIDEKGNPLPGATVLAKGTTKAVLTNAVILQSICQQTVLN
jgi:hypothetical protein